MHIYQIFIDFADHATLLTSSGLGLLEFGVSSWLVIAGRNGVFS